MGSCSQETREEGASSWLQVAAGLWQRVAVSSPAGGTPLSPGPGIPPPTWTWLWKGQLVGRGGPRARELQPQELAALQAMGASQHTAEAVPVSAVGRGQAGQTCLRSEEGRMRSPQPGQEAGGGGQNVGAVAGTCLEPTGLWRWAEHPRPRARCSVMAHGDNVTLRVLAWSGPEGCQSHEHFWLCWGPGWGLG